MKATTTTATPRTTRSRTKTLPPAAEPPVKEVDEDLEMAEKKAKRKVSVKKSATDSRKKIRKEEPLERSIPKAEMTLDASTSSDLCVEGEEGGVDDAGEVFLVEEEEEKKKKKTGRGRTKRSMKVEDDRRECRFVGSPISGAEAKRRWPDRYQKRSSWGRSSTNGDEPDDDAIPAKCHYERARVEGNIYHLLDDVYVKAEPGNPDYIGRIVEFFEAIDGKFYFTSQWFFRVEDTVIGKVGGFHDPKRVFLSDEKNINVLDCVVSKINIVQRDSQQIGPIPTCDLYYNMYYSIPYSSFTNLPRDKAVAGSEESSTVSYDDIADSSNELPLSAKKATVLDLYSGCGAMSTGLCHGAQLAGLNIETMWAVDINSDACCSLQLNHPNTKVRNESAEHFLALLKEWEKLCKKYSNFKDLDSDESSQDGSLNENDVDESDDEFVVEKFFDISYGDPAKIGKNGIQLKVRWQGYGPDEDTWEPIENLGNCDERMGNFVRWGMKTCLVPLPGDVDIVCGGPPCQGISGFNRFRNSNNPLDDEKNRQMVIYMEIVDHLKPRFVLMENVVDILKFSKGFLGRYALSFLVSRNYQARLGIMAAGCYGLPQFRLRVFLWGAQAEEILPQFPLPTYNVVVRGGVPVEFEQNLVAYAEGEHRELKEALLLGDAISDLPSVTNFEEMDEMLYDKPPKTEFQRFIRTPKYAVLNSPSQKRKQVPKLFDHRPLRLNTDDYQRVRKIPKFKGANFRNLPGLCVGPDNVIELDTTVERPLLPSGKPLVPDYAISFIKGKSLKPFGRLWWDETVPTVVTRAEPHNQTILHPEQDRVLTIRENARLQGFPDHYQLIGSIKGRYIQVGNAVAFPVSRALGYALGLAYQKQILEDGPALKLPKDFPLPN